MALDALAELHRLAGVPYRTLQHTEDTMTDALYALTRLAKVHPTEDARRKYLREHPKADPKNHTVRKSQPPTKKPEKPSDLFPSARVKDLPDTTQQKVSDPDKLFAEAKKAHEEQLDLLNRGSGLDAVVKGSVVRVDKGENIDLDQPGPVIVIGPMKKKERSREKVETNFGGDWSKLIDVVRASVAVDSFSQIQDVIAGLDKKGMKLARKPLDRFANPTEAGYRDLSLSIVYPNGHVGELQIHLKSVLKAKDEGHKFYEDVRSIQAAAKKEGRTTLTAEEAAKVEKANKAMRELYDRAWKDATMTPSSKKQGAVAIQAASRKHFRYEGVPAYLDRRKFPVLVTPKGEKVLYELEKFFREAEPISQKEFDAMTQKKKEALHALEKLAMEHPSEEARREYLRKHPKADPKNHTVRDPSKKQDSTKKPKSPLHDVAKKAPAALRSLYKDTPSGEIDKNDDPPAMKNLREKLKQLPLKKLEGMVEQSMKVYREALGSRKGPLTDDEAPVFHRIQNFHRALTDAAYAVRQESKSTKKAGVDHLAALETLARFPKGVPADPTENMSEEDAAKWQEMNEKYKDQFKTAGAVPIEYVKAAQKLLAANKGRTQDDLHYRTYLRGVIAEQPVAHLANKFPGARRARQDLIDEVGRGKFASAPKLTPEQVAEIRKELVPNGVPVRFMFNGQNLDIVTGKTLPKGVNVMHQIVYWNFTKPTIQKIVEWFGGKVKAVTDKSASSTDKTKYDNAWVAWIKDPQGYVIRFFGPSSKSTVVRLMRSYLSTNDHLEGEYMHVPYALQRSLWGRRINEPAFSKLPPKDKKNLQELLDYGSRKTAASGLPGDERESRFEEGVPADPTENMSEEDAQVWHDEHEKHKDQFKNAALDLEASWTFVGAEEDDEVEEADKTAALGRAQLDVLKRIYKADAERFGDPPKSGKMWGRARSGISRRVADSLVKAGLLEGVFWSSRGGWVNLKLTPAGRAVAAEALAKEQQGKTASAEDADETQKTAAQLPDIRPLISRLRKIKGWKHLGSHLESVTDWQELRPDEFKLELMRVRDDLLDKTFLEDNGVEVDDREAKNLARTIDSLIAKVRGKTANYQTVYKPLLNNLPALVRDISAQPFVADAHLGTWEEDYEPGARSLNRWRDDTTPAIFATLNVYVRSPEDARKMQAWLRSNAKKYNVKRIQTGMRPPRTRDAYYTPAQFMFYVMLAPTGAGKLAAEEVEIEDDSEGLDKTAAAKGLYGFTKGTQSDCEACIRKLSRTAQSLAKKAWMKDENVAPFLQTHAKRAGSLPARILVQAMKDLGPRIAEEVEEEIEEAEQQGKTAVQDWSKPPRRLDPETEDLWYNIWLLAINNGQAYQSGNASKAVTDAFDEYKRIQNRTLSNDFIAIRKDLVKHLTQYWQDSRKTASAKGRRYGLYGFSAKTSALGLSTVTQLREAAGHIAGDLHSRRADKHAHITEFFNTHGKQARCLYSKLLCASYPDSEFCTGKKASVAEWLAWEPV